MRQLIPVLGFLAGLPAMAVHSAEPGEIVTYTAQYEVRYKGRRVARAEFSVAETDDGQFVFNSVTRARGVWRIASPRPAIESSLFDLRAQSIVPASFRYEDGSRKGEDNYTLEFDAANSEVRINGRRGSLSVPFEDGLLDRGSLQVALMLELSRCELPGPLRYVDDDGVRQYEYERLEDLTIETDIGEMPTVRFAQQREGSSRTTILWLASEFAYVPARIEQIRDGEVETVFTLENLAGLERQASSCSSLR